MHRLVAVFVRATALVTITVLAASSGQAADASHPACAYSEWVLVPVGHAVRDSEDPSLGYICQPPEVVGSSALTPQDRNALREEIVGPMDGR